MQQKHRQVAYGVRGHVVLVIETEGETIADNEVPSSTRLRKAAPVNQEFEDLKAWRESAERARRAS